MCLNVILFIATTRKKYLLKAMKIITVSA